MLGFSRGILARGGSPLGTECDADVHLHPGATCKLRAEKEMEEFDLYVKGGTENNYLHTRTMGLHEVVLVLCMAP